MNGESVLSEWLARLQQGRVWRRQAEEYLQMAAEIGRTSNISLGKLTELLAMFYEEGK